MTHESNELALCIINENTERFPYQKRCDIARNRSAMRWETSRDWLRLCSQFATFHEGHYETMKFKPSDILIAAGVVSDYYERHVAEMEVA